MGEILKTKKINFFNFEFHIIEIFLFFGFVLFHIANIPCLRFLYNDMEVLSNLYRFENAAQVKVPYITYTTTYGPFLSYVHAIFYKMMPSGIFSTNIILLVISPIISLCIGYVCARLIFRDHFYRICFLILSILLVVYTESWYYSCRVWISLLSLAFFSSGLIRKKKGYLLFSGAVLAAAFFTSPEIAIFTFVSIILVIFVILLLDNKELAACCLFVFGLFFTILILSLLFHKFIIKYFASVVTQAQNYNWAMGWSFPGIFSARQKIAFGYFRPFAIHLLGLITIVCIFLSGKRNSKMYLAKILPFVLFGIFFQRTLLSRTDDGHLHFILAPSVIVLILLIEICLIRRQPAVDFIRERYFLSLFVTTIVCLLFFRNILWDQIEIFIERFRTTSKSDESFYSPLSVFLKKDLEREFIGVSNYIKNNTSTNDFIYVFPRGPYYFLTGRKNATIHYDDIHLLYTKDMRAELINQIEKNRAAYIINPIVWFPCMNGFLFAREMNEYVQTHFFLEKIIENVFIFKRRDYPIQKKEPAVTKVWSSGNMSEIRLDGLSGQFGKSQLKVIKAMPTFEFTCSPSLADSVEIRVSLLRYFPFLRALAKPSLELVSYDADGMVTYDKLAVPSDGNIYPIRYEFKKAREIIKMEFTLNAPGLFNPNPLYIFVENVSLLMK